MVIIPASSLRRDAGRNMASRVLRSFRYIEAGDSVMDWNTWVGEADRMPAIRPARRP